MILRKDNLESVKELEVDTTPVKVAWHSKINQVFIFSCDMGVHLTATSRS